MPQANDFLDESEALHALIDPLSDERLGQPTAFKGWTINHVIGHLHVWNHAADLSLEGDEAFQGFYKEVVSHMAAGGTLSSFERHWLKGLEGRALVKTWRESFIEIAGRFGEADPSMRVQWAGPSMSVRSSITARLMETWAHGQEVYDTLGVVRRNADRIRNIVVLGVNTYGWTFKVRGQEPPEPMPHLRLTGPSGELWTHGEPSEAEVIEGLAEEFCQVVTQTRNIADTALQVTGPNAESWMRQAQCFAGPPETPPAPGQRKTATLSR
ncbi:MAG: TIGR03084 family metal-binding protein [Deltaproteobacteria bacterium]|nr:TIGR03084 family metal-binding protein [Deltaproteobacteria bacterium]